MKKKKQRRENTRRDVCSQGGSAIAHTHTHIHTHTYIHTHARTYIHMSRRKNNRCADECLHRTRHRYTHTHTHSLTYITQIYIAHEYENNKTNTYIWLVGRHRTGQTREFRFRGTRRRGKNGFDDAI